MAHAAEPLLAITQSTPVEAMFLEKSKADLVPPQDVEELMFFGFSDPRGQAPELKQSAAQVALGKVTPKVTKVHVIFIVVRRGCKFLIQFFICTCRTDLRRQEHSQGRLIGASSRTERQELQPQEQRQKHAWRTRTLAIFLRPGSFQPGSSRSPLSRAQIATGTGSSIQRPDLPLLAHSGSHVCSPVLQRTRQFAPAPRQSLSPFLTFLWDRNFLESPNSFPSSVLLYEVDKVIVCNHFFKVVVDQTSELDARRASPFTLRANSMILALWRLPSAAGGIKKVRPIISSGFKLSAAGLSVCGALFPNLRGSSEGFSSPGFRCFRWSARLIP